METDKFGNPFHIKVEEVSTSIPSDGQFEAWQDKGERVVVEQELEFSHLPFSKGEYPEDMCARIFEIKYLDWKDKWQVTVKEPFIDTGIPDKIVEQNEYFSKEEAISDFEDVIFTNYNNPSVNSEVSIKKRLGARVDMIGIKLLGPLKYGLLKSFFRRNS